MEHHTILKIYCEDEECKGTIQNIDHVMTYKEYQNGDNEQK